MKLLDVEVWKRFMKIYNLKNNIKQKLKNYETRRIRKEV